MEQSSPSIASIVGKSILAAYRELTGPEVRKVESSASDGTKKIDFAKLERLIRRCSSRQEMLRLRRQIAMQYHPDTRAAQSHHDATATMARVNAMFDEALRTHFPENAK